MIHLRSALRLMDSTEKDGKMSSFSIKAFRYNRRTEKGGTLLHVKNASLYTKQASEPIPAKRRAGNKTRKNPNHFINRTRNLINNDTGNLFKVNIGLIVEFNGQPVYL